MVPLLNELSKTNYVYVPLRARNDEEFKEILQNLLDGERKQVLYKDLIQQFYDVKDRILREIYVDKVANQIMRKAADEER